MNRFLKFIKGLLPNRMLIAIFIVGYVLTWALDTAVFDRPGFNIDYDINYEGVKQDMSEEIKQKIIQQLKRNTVKIHDISVVVYDQQSSPNFYHIDCRIWANMDKKRKFAVSDTVITLFSNYLQNQRPRGTVRIFSTGFLSKSSSTVYF